MSESALAVVIVARKRFDTALSTVLLSHVLPDYRVLVRIARIL
ncbi:MAG: hypothetical protein R3D57_03690 [Hyphomicrobiaceae bacterium]